MLVLIIVIIFSGFKFYRLANDFQKNKLLFVFLGLLSFFIGILLLSIVIAIYVIFTNNSFIFEERNNSVLGYAGLLFCMIFSWSYYYYLKNKWSKVNIDFSETDLIDSNLD